MRKFLAAALLVIGAMTIPLTTTTTLVAAQAPDQQAWWWQYRELPLPADPKTVVPQYSPPQVPPPASVPEDGLYVAGQASGPEAIAAVSFVIPEGAAAKTLTLVAAAPLPPTTTIRLCPTNTPWQPVQAGAWSSKPIYTCAADAPVGVVPTDGAKVTFTLGALGNQQLIDVALVPTDQSVFQANFNKPDKNALEVQAGASADVSSSVGTGSGVLGTSNEYTSLNSAVNDPSYLPALSDSLQPLPEQGIGGAPTLDYAQPGGTATPVVRAAATKDNLQNFGFFGLLALAVLFTRFRNQPDHEPKSLVNFGKKAT
jgi:hypothetical protein